MWTVIGIVAFLIGLAFSIAWHELGHLAFAKLFNVRTTQYMVGFGKTLWSKQVGETEYGIKAIPLGGYIRMVGMVPPPKPGRRGRFRGPTTTALGPAGMVRQLIEDTRATDRAQVMEADEGRQFYQLHPFKRIVIMAAGPVMNLILAVGVFAVILVGIGIQQPVPVVSSVSECVIAASEERTECLAGDPATPAAAAGLRPGDVITSFRDQSVTDWDQLRVLIAASGGDTVTMTWTRDGEPMSAEIPIIATERNRYDDQGQFTGTAVVGFLGVGPEYDFVSQSFGAAVDRTGEFIARAAQAVADIPARIPALWTAIVDDVPRDPASPVGIVGAGRISGEILELDTTGTEKMVLFLQLLAGFNMSLFLLNMLPLLPLDGGHILGAVIEWVRRGWAKLFRRQAPGPFDVATLMPVAYLVALLFIGLTLLTLVADIVNPVKLFG